MNKPIKVGMLGVGQRGLQHLKALWQLQSEGLVEITALADSFAANLDGDKIRSFVPDYREDNIKLSTAFGELIKENKPDVLYLAIPPNLHRGEVISAAQAGVHLFVEKPMSLYLDEALEMETAIKEAGVYSAVGFQQRFEPRHETVKEFLSDKRVIQANYTFHTPIEFHNVKHMPTETVGGPTNRIWTASRAWTGTTAVENGIHTLDLWRYWLGDVEWVQANYVNRLPSEIIEGADNPHSYNIFFGFDNGVVANMALSRLRRVYNTYLDHQILWNEGRLVLDPDEFVSYHYDGTYPPEILPDDSQIRHSLNVDPVDVTLLDYSTLGISRNFIEAIITQSPEIIRSPFSDAMNSLTAVIAANVSDSMDGTRIYIEDLITDENYAPHRDKKDS